MNILYLSTSVIPSRFANSIQVMKMCEAFVNCGNNVILLAPRRKGSEAGIADVFGYYGVRKVFGICYFPWPNVPMGRYLYAVLALIYIMFHRNDIVYTRNAGLSLFAALLRKRVVYEAHHIDDRFGAIPAWIFKKLIKRKSLCAFVVISRSIKNYYVDQHNIPAEKVIVAPDGADDSVDKFVSKMVALSNSLNVGYVGHLYEGKGMEVVEKIAKRKPDVNFHVIGGCDVDINYWSKRISDKNVYFHGFIKPSKISSYINALDVCLLPNQDVVLPLGLKNAKYNIAEFTSPLKLFEYMSHKKAIIASDMPVLREILIDGHNCLLCRNDDPDSWVAAIDRLQDDAAMRTKLGETAYKDFEEKYSWKRRAENLTGYLEEVVHS